MATTMKTSDSSEEEIFNSSWSENDPLREAKLLGSNLSKLENAATARQRKIQGLQQVQTVVRYTQRATL